MNKAGSGNSRMEVLVVSRKPLRVRTIAGYLRNYCSPVGTPSESTKMVVVDWEYPPDDWINYFAEKRVQGVTVLYTDGDCTDTDLLGEREYISRAVTAALNPDGMPVECANQQTLARTVNLIFNSMRHNEAILKESILLSVAGSRQQSTSS